MKESFSPDKEKTVIYLPNANASGQRQSQISFLFGEIIKENRKKQGMSQQDLADQMQVARNTVVNWETNRRTPDFEIMPRLCSVLKISIETLFGFADVSDLDATEHKLIVIFRQLSSVGKKLAMTLVDTMLTEECKAADKNYLDSYHILALEPGAAAAGEGYEYTDEKPTPVFFRKTDINVKADAIVRVSGASMEPEYHEGDFVYISYTDSADIGDDVVCATRNGLVIKRKDGKGHLYSVNAALPFGKKYEDDNVKIKGKVLGIVSPSEYADKDELSILNELFRDQLREFYATHV